MDEGKKIKGNNKSGGTKYIIWSIVFADLLVLVIIADLYFMITNITNIVPIIITTVVGVALTSLLVICLIGMAGESKKAYNAYYENQMKTLRAIYLMIKKNNGNITDSQTEVLSSIDALSKEIVLNLKAASKVVVSRNKENTDALMNSNDIILEKLLNLISDNNKAQGANNYDYSADFAEIKTKLEELSISVQNGISVGIPSSNTTSLDIQSMDNIGMDTSSMEFELSDVADEGQEVVLKGLEEILEAEGLNNNTEENIELEEEIPDLDSLLAMSEMLPEADDFDNNIEDIPLFTSDTVEETDAEMEYGDIPIFAPDISTDAIENEEPFVETEPELVAEPEPVAEPMPTMESKPVSLGDMDSNEKLTPEQIAELIASMTS